MRTEIQVSDKAVNATVILIHEYLTKGGEGIDHDALAEMLDALSEADRIFIAPSGQE